MRVCSRRGPAGPAIQRAVVRAEGTSSQAPSEDRARTFP